MAKKIKEDLIKQAEDLVTPREETRAGFIALALEKNYIAIPYVEEAKTLKNLASKVNKPMDLLKLDDLRAGLLTASAVSDKALNYLTEDDKTEAIKGLIKEFLEPAGDKFIDELVYRYLLTKGDALGGKSRNLAGTLAERKFLRFLISAFNLAGIDYQWLDIESKEWIDKNKEAEGIEKRIKAIYWTKGKVSRLIIMNINVPIVEKNIDFIIMDGKYKDLKKGKDSIIYSKEKYIALGELKGGIDPAGADEHWKTANSAINRIRTSFNKEKQNPHTLFIGAAIENSMASEIFEQLQKGILSNAANLTNDKQLTSICNWIINL
ncbi:MAG: AvaI/BsoBI family type II restriction endonuclease [Desulfobacterales bacterium]